MRREYDKSREDKWIYLRKNIDKVMKTMRWKVKLGGEFGRKFNKMRRELRIVMRNIKVNIRDGDRQEKKILKWQNREVLKMIRKNDWKK